jgi:hypothetical protein
MARRAELFSLSSLDDRTRTIGLLLVVVDSIFGASIFAGAISANLTTVEFTVAIVTLGVVLVGTLVAITTIERAAAAAQPGVTPSKGTPSIPLLNKLIDGTLEMVCRATSLPQTPESARLRAFIFRVEEGQQLVCRYFWAPNRTKEEAGITRFSLTGEESKEFVVVQCVLSGEIVRSPVRLLSGAAQASSTGPVDENLRFVLAAPIFQADGHVWGTVDFDASTHTGESLLSTDVSDAAMFQLAQHLQIMFSLGPSASERPVAGN